MTVTHRIILDLLGSQQDILDALRAEGFQLGQPAISNWKAREDVPAPYWPALVKLAHGKLLPDGSPVTFETFACSQRRVREAGAA